MKLLNIGCGLISHPAWINLDIEPATPDVYAYDLTQGLPYTDAYFDACYSSHVLEHLTQFQAKNLVRECFRVLKSQGIIRVIVPDLEVIARLYLTKLEQIESGHQDAIPDYEWMMLELYDQTVRDRIGGEMGDYLRQPDLPNKSFIQTRIGTQTELFWHPNFDSQKVSIWKKMSSKRPAWLIHRLRSNLAEFCIRFVAGKKAQQAFREGIFRHSGEVHRWMYDRFSLRRLLENAGFVEVTVCCPNQSRIPDFNQYNLDVTNSKVRKPDSLFMEAIKP